MCSDMGENPYSQVMQDHGTLLGIANVPADYPYHKLYAPFTNRGAIEKRIEKTGWIFCHAGSMLFAFRCVKPYSWDTTKWNECDLLWCDARKNGWVVETSEVSVFAGGGIEAELSRFADAVLAKTAIDVSEIDAENPKITYRSLHGTTLELNYLPHKVKYTDQCKIDGKVVDYESWPLHRSEWVEQAKDGSQLIVRINGKFIEYDFTKWSSVARHFDP